MTKHYCDGCGAETETFSDLTITQPRPAKDGPREISISRCRAELCAGCVARVKKLLAVTVTAANEHDERCEARPPIMPLTDSDNCGCRNRRTVTR